MVAMMTVLLLVSLCLLPTSCGRTLEAYNVDPDSVTISGFSSGSSAAVQMHMAYSSLYKGMGAIGAVNYFCTEGDNGNPKRDDCVYDVDIDPYHLADETRRIESENTIDSLSNLANTKVWLMAGELDRTVYDSCIDTMYDYYREFMPAENIFHDKMADLVHGWPTEEYGTACNAPNFDVWINKCDYLTAWELLQYFYDETLQKPNINTPTNGDFYEFDQTEFLDGEGMDEFGFLYVPTNCMDKQTTCRLHIHLHGCGLGRFFVDDRYARNTFFDHVGELNDVIIMYNQATRSANNLNGCWDWYGLHDNGDVGRYVTRDAGQNKAVYDMVQRIIGN